MKNMNLNDFQNRMVAEWWICKEDAGTLTNANETMSGRNLMAAIREADAWDQSVSDTLPGLEVKDLLATLCDILGVDWQDAEDWQEAYNRLERFIDTVE